jgi:hypothetical protein
MMAGVAFSASAVGPLQFTNITSQVAAPAKSLLGAAYDRNSTFVLVGSNSTILEGTFIANQSNKWAQVPTNIAPKLNAVTWGNGLFLAGGTSNKIFSSSDGVTWTNGGQIFPNTAEAAALAFNDGDGRFVTVAQAPEIAAADASSLSWTVSTLNPHPTFLESFRGVTPVGGNGFVACGILGDIRTSADGGASWQLNQGHVNLPDLLGIAADDGQTVVSVGVRSNGLATAIVSTDGGVTWNPSTGTTSDNLNAVAFSGMTGGFVAVGSNGVILVSTDSGVSWSPRPKITPSSLYGIAFGRTNLFSGVGVIVGQGGTVLLAGTAPATPILPVNQTNFSSSLPNPPLSATIVNDLDHPVGTVTMDWYNSSGALVSSGTVNFTPLDTLPAGDNAAANYTYFAVARDLRTGFTNSTALPVVLSIVPRPKSTITSPLVRTNCNDGSPFTLTNVLTGIGPWIIQWSTGDVQTNTDGGSGPVINTLTIFPTNTTTSPISLTYSVTSLTAFLTNNGTVVMGTALAGDLIGTNELTINPRPTSMLTSLDQTNCNNGTPFTITAALTGTAPWTVTWSDGLTLSYGASPAVRTVVATNVNPNAALTFTLWVNALSDANCTAEPQDLMGTNTLTIFPNPPPPVSLGNVTNCFGITNPPLSVTVTNGATADWFDANTNLLFAGTTNFISTNTAVGVYTNYALTRLIDSGCTSADFTPVLFVIQDCTNLISGITLDNGTNAVVQWYGNFVLQSATNLSPPVTWITLTQGIPGITNSWTNSTVPPPDANFFRLYAPTN